MTWRSPCRGQDNCEGQEGTYCLYREAGESTVRLYDLTALSRGRQERRWKYTVAMLCARYAKQTSMLQGPTERRTTRALLRHAATLLEDVASSGGKGHPIIRADIHAQLADAFVAEASAQPPSAEARYRGALRHNRRDLRDDGSPSPEEREDDAPRVCMLERAAFHLDRGAAAFKACDTLRH